MTAIQSSSPSLVFYELPRGKPNPEEPRIPGSDLRERVVQKAQKGPNCLYYALQRLRDHFGKRTDDSLRKERAFEKLASEWKKANTNLHENIMFFMNPDIQEIFKFWENKTKASETIKQGLDVLKKERGSSVQLDERLSLINRFCDQTTYSDFYEFLGEFEEEETCKINLSFLEKMNRTPEKMFEELRVEMARIGVIVPCSWDSLKLPARRSWVIKFVHRCLREGYHFKESFWNPNQSIEELIKALNKEGPLQVEGDFGDGFYKTPPQIMKRKVAEREIFFWPKGSERITKQSIHAVVIIGAEKVREKEGVVYFLDPNDEDNPRELQQKIYAMSYKTLTEQSSSFTPFFGAEQKRLITVGMPFAAYGPIQFPKIRL